MGDQNRKFHSLFSSVAGNGTNFTNLPVESSPLLEVLLKEIEASESSKPDSNSDPGTPPNVVFVYHSHSWKEFLPLLKGIKNPNEAASLNDNKNIIAVGKRLQEELIKRGIGTSQSKANVTEELKKRN